MQPRLLPKILLAVNVAVQKGGGVGWVRAALVVAGLPPVMVAPFSRKTMVLSVAEAVCSHIPSLSASAACTVYSKVAVAEVVKVQAIFRRLLVRLLSLDPTSRRRNATLFGLV